MLRDLLFRLRAILRRNVVEHELDEELRFHLERQIELFERQGLTPDEARRRARLAFGGLDQVKDDCRDARGVSLVENVVRDVRHGARLLRRSPGFTAVAVLSIGIGVGANAAIFAFVDAFLFRPLPVRDANRIVALADRTDRHAGWPISYPNFLDWRERNHVFDRMAAYRNTLHVLGDESGAERVRALNVSTELLAVVGAEPVLGRDLLPAEHDAGGDRTALVGYELWQRRFGGEPGILGRSITLDGRPFTIVGVLPKGFNVGARADVLTAEEQWGQDRRGSHNSLYGIGRLKPGVTLEQARSEMDVIAAQLEREHPDTNRHVRVDILPLGHVRMGETLTPLLMLMAAVGFVLLIACANLANLLLSRAAGRAREIAIRRAVGATRPRLILQLLTESLLIAGLGGVVGLLIGTWACRGLVALSGDLARWPGGEAVTWIGLDGRVLLFLGLATLAAGIAAGLVPALQASRGDLTPPLKEGSKAPGGGRDTRRFRDAMVALEVALAVVLLAGAGLLVRSLHALVTDDMGFDSGNVLTFSLTRGTINPQALMDRAALYRKQEDSTRRILDELSGMPGVEAAAVAFPLPFGHGSSGTSFHVEGRPVPSDGSAADAVLRQVSPGYCRALGLHIRAGRWFTERDDDFVMVVNETTARESWPGREAVGRHVRLGTPGGFSPWYTVIGVAADTKESGLDARHLLEIYVRRYGGSDILVRVAGDPSLSVPGIRARIRTIERDRAMFDIQPLNRLIAESVRDRRILTWLLGTFSAVALLLAAIGIYGVVAHNVERRTQEVGVRVALGARAGDVVKLVLAQAMRPVVLGIAVGAIASFGATRVLSSWLFGVSPTDPATFITVAALLVLVALGACLAPLLRATRVDPVVALRCE